MNQKQTKEYGEYLVSLANGNDNIDLNYIIENRPKVHEDIQELQPHLIGIIKEPLSYESNKITSILYQLNAWGQSEELQIFGMKDEDRKEYNILQGQTIVKLLTLELEPLQLIKPKLCNFTILVYFFTISVILHYGVFLHYLSYPLHYSILYCIKSSINFFIFFAKKP